jgi:chromosome partitioning protein
VEPGGFHLLPANQDLTAAEVRLLQMPAGRETKLRNALAPVRDSYDVVLIDCPPALNILTVNSLVAADSVLIPMQCEYYALEGLSALLGTVEQIRAAVNPELQIEGILRTMCDPRNNLATEVSAQLIMHFGDKVFRTIIPRNIRLAEAPSFGKPVLFHDKESRGALSYLALAGEMIRREEEEASKAAATAASGASGGSGANGTTEASGGGGANGTTGASGGSGTNGTTGASGGSATSAESRVDATSAEPREHEATAESRDHQASAAFRERDASAEAHERDARAGSPEGDPVTADSNVASDDLGTASYPDASAQHAAADTTASNGAASPDDDRNNSGSDDETHLQHGAHTG